MVKKPTGWQLVTSLQLAGCLYSWKLNQYGQTASGWRLVTSLQPVACLYSWKLNHYCQTVSRLTTCHQPAAGWLLVGNTFEKAPPAMMTSPEPTCIDDTIRWYHHVPGTSCLTTTCLVVTWPTSNDDVTIVFDDKLLLPKWCHHPVINFLPYLFHAWF